MFLKLTHANNHNKILININHIAGMYISPTDKCTHIVSVGAIFPVKESLDDIERLINGRIRQEDK